jgi:hypothetical protein
MSLKTENSRRVAKSRPVCMGLKTLKPSVHCGYLHKIKIKIICITEQQVAKTSYHAGFIICHLTQCSLYTCSLFIT